MKIKNWEDLHKVRNVDYEILYSSNGSSIIIETHYGSTAGLICTSHVRNEDVLRVLSAYGFDVEIDKPKQLNCFSEYHVLLGLKAQGIEYISRDSEHMGNELYGYNLEPTKGKSYWEIPEDDADDEFSIQIKKDMFDFIKWEDEKPHEVSEMLKWKVKGE